MFGYRKLIFMEFLEEVDSTYVVIALAVVFLIGHFIVQRQNSLKLTLQYRLIFYGLVMVILLFHLPITPSLSTFGYPMDISDVANNKKLLKYLQEYNEAIVKTTEVVNWMIFITVFWFVSIISSMIKHFKLEKSPE